MLFIICWFVLNGCRGGGYTSVGLGIEGIQVFKLRVYHKIFKVQKVKNVLLYDLYYNTNSHSVGKNLL